MNYRRCGLGAAFFAALGLCAAVTAAPADSAPSAARAHLGVQFLSLPEQVFEGQRTTFRASVGTGGKTCALVIRYKGGKLQRLAARHVVNGSVSWTVRIAAAPPGYATLSASCSGAGRATGRVLVQWALQAPKLTIAKRGYSQRNDAYGNSSVNFGLAVKNERDRFDATDIAILVNFVDATNRVLGTTHLSVGRVPAAKTIYVGGQVGLSSQVPVSRLEVVFVSATSAQRLPAVPPLISDVVLTPRDGYLDSLHGQLLNKYRLILDGGDIGVVFVDAAGNILGGGTGGADGPVSLGARETFGFGGDFNAIPMNKIATMLFSVVPNYHGA